LTAVPLWEFSNYERHEPLCASAGPDASLYIPLALFLGSKSVSLKLRKVLAKCISA